MAALIVAGGVFVFVFFAVCGIALVVAGTLSDRRM